MRCDCSFPWKESSGLQVDHHRHRRRNLFSEFDYSFGDDSHRCRFLHHRHRNHDTSRGRAKIPGRPTTKVLQFYSELGPRRLVGCEIAIAA